MDFQKILAIAWKELHFVFETGITPLKQTYTNILKNDTPFLFMPVCLRLDYREK